MKMSSTQQGKIHDVWHPVNNYQAWKAAGKCDSWEGRAISQNQPRAEAGLEPVYEDTWTLL